MVSDSQIVRKNIFGYFVFYVKLIHCIRKKFDCTYPQVSDAFALVVFILVLVRVWTVWLNLLMPSKERGFALLSLNQKVFGYTTRPGKMWSPKVYRFCLNILEGSIIVYWSGKPSSCQVTFFCLLLHIFSGDERQRIRKSLGSDQDSRRILDSLSKVRGRIFKAFKKVRCCQLDRESL